MYLTVHFFMLNTQQYADLFQHRDFLACRRCSHHRDDAVGTGIPRGQWERRNTTFEGTQRDWLQQNKARHQAALMVGRQLAPSGDLCLAKWPFMVRIHTFRLRHGNQQLQAQQGSIVKWRVIARFFALRGSVQRHPFGQSCVACHGQDVRLHGNLLRQQRRSQSTQTVFADPVRCTKMPCQFIHRHHQHRLAQARSHVTKSLLRLLGP